MTAVEIDHKWTRIRSEALQLLDQYNRIVGLQEKIDLLETQVSEISATILTGKWLISIYRKQFRYAKKLKEMVDGDNVEAKVAFYRRKLEAYGADLEANNLVLDIPDKIRAEREIRRGCKGDLIQVELDLTAARVAHPEAVSLAKQLKTDLAGRIRMRMMATTDLARRMRMGMRMTATDISLDEKWATLRFHGDKVAIEYLIRFMEQGILQCEVNLLFTLGFSAGVSLKSDVEDLIRPFCRGGLELSWAKLYRLQSAGAGVRELTVVEADDETKTLLNFRR